MFILTSLDAMYDPTLSAGLGFENTPYDDCSIFGN